MATVPTATTKPWHKALGRWALRAPIIALAAIACAHSVQSQELIYKEDFNTEGEGTRYTVEGRGFVPKNGQLIPVPAGTSYWNRNVDVVAQGEVVGVPFPAPARRAILIYHQALDPVFLTDDGKKLIDATIKWLTDGKTNMVVMFSAPRGACDTAFGDCYLVDIFTAAGHTVIDDDVAGFPVLGDIITTNKVDLIISGAGGDPIRLASASVPLLCFNEAITGDMLLATSGDLLTFDPGDVKIEAPTHPIAAGLPATLKFVTESQALNTIGLGLPPGSVTVASYQFTDDAGVVSTRPFLVVTEKGVQLLGGLVSGMEGSGYWAGADMNEPKISGFDESTMLGTFGTITEPRSLTLNAVNVTGKPKLKLTFALAGTEVDFDGPGPDDFLSIKVDTGTGEFIELARYGSPTATEKFLVEMIKGGDGLGGPPELVIPNYTNRIGIVARDLTYDIPDGATQLRVRFEANSTFWNEIVAFDNIRITSGDIVTPPPSGDLTGLLGYWRMDETSGTAVSDSTGKGNNGNIINGAAGAWVADSERGQVYRATGTNVIEFGTIIPAMTTSNDFTWSLWIKSDETGTAAAANNNIVFGNRYNSSGADFNPREFIKFTPSNFEWHFNAAGQNVNYDDFVTNKWTHHLVVKQGTNLTYYLDGAQSTNGTITGGPTNPQPLYLGGQGTLERWKGLADEVAIFDRALSATEAKQAYDLGKAGESLAPPVSGGATISIARSANDAVITFTGTLEAADAVNGPYAAVAGATSPRTVPLSSATAKFYRSRQ